MSSSSTDSYDNVINVESSEVTRTASSSAGGVSSSDHSVDRRSTSPNYEWIDPRVLNIHTSFRISNSLYNFFFFI